MDDKVTKECLIGSLISLSPNVSETSVINSNGDDSVIVGEDGDLVDTATSSPEIRPKSEHSEAEKPVEWVQWRESLDANDPSDVLPNGELQIEVGNNGHAVVEPSPSSSVVLTNDEETVVEPLVSVQVNQTVEASEPTDMGSRNPSSCPFASLAVVDVKEDSREDTTNDKKGVEAAT